MVSVKMDDWQRLTFYPLKWIFLGGLHPESKSIVATLLFLCNFLFFGVVTVLAVIGILVSYEDNIYFTIESILTVVLYLHIISKYTILYKHKDTLRHLLEQRTHFWNLEDFDGTVRTDCEKSLKTAFNVTKYYLIYSLTVVTNFLLQPIILKQLPVFLYVPDGWFYYLFFSFFPITPAIMASIWGVDTIYYTVTMPISIQLKLLANKFKTFDFNKEKSELKRLIDYHNFLLRYCTQINKMTSGIFLTQFLVAIATSCMQLFIASQPEFGLMNKIKCLSYFTMQIIETAMYTFTADLISESSEDVGNAIYRSAWYDIADNDVKKELVMAIARSHKQVTFNGLGLVRINMETFTRIFKTALSFYTYLNTMVYTD